MVKPGARRRLLIGSAVFGVLLVVGAGAAVAYYLADTGGEQRTIRGLVIEGRPAGHLTVNELDTLVSDIAGEVALQPVEVVFPDGPRPLTAADVGVALDRDDLRARALAAGTTGGSIDRFVAWARSFLDTTRPVSYRLTFDPDRARQALSELDGLVVSEPVEPDLALSTEQELIVRPGQVGVEIDIAPVVARLAELAANRQALTVEAPTRPLPPRIDEEALAAVAAELNDLTAGGARVIVGPEERTIPAEALRVRLDTTGDPSGPEPTFDLASLQRLIEHTFGDVTIGGEDPQFDIVDDEPVVVEPGSVAKVCCSEDAAATVATAVLGGRRAPIRLDPAPTEDERLVAWAEGEGVVEKVSEFTTPHNCCENRVSNIHRIADIVRGAYLLPGESLSLNEYVGERTPEKGFVPAGTILQGHLVPTVGGGVSQFATTTFNAAFFAGFDFEVYQSHSIYFSRYPYGREATISWPAPDLAFTNTTDYPALIWTSYTDTSITVSVYSTKSVEVEQIGQEVSAARQCTRVDTFRRRTYEDGREVEDSVFATYRPGEGLDCNGDPTEAPET